MAIARNAILAFLVSLLWVSQLAAQTQTGTIIGRVADAATTEALVGAGVVIEGMRREATTGADGSFTLTDVPTGTHRVMVRYIGYAQGVQEVTVTAGQTARVDFSLQRQALVMDEVVVTGYGSQRRAAITGSVTAIDVGAANVGVITNVNDLIQGRVAGVLITQNHGEPGAGQQITIRGGTSISAANDPLYVIDGVVIQNLATESSGIGIGGGAGDVNSFSQAALPRSPLNLLNPNDIESITILKDAAASAIYGTRGANGVILIETKQGRRGESTFEYDAYVSVASPARTLDLLDANLEVFEPRHAQVLEYWLDVSMFSRWKRPAVKLPWRPEVCADDVQTYASRGIRHVTSFAVMIDSDYVRRFGEPPIEEYGQVLRNAAG